MPMTSLCWPLLPTSWRRRRTNYALLWWSGQMRNNWPLLLRNPVWRCSQRIPTSPGSTLKCESAMRWPHWNEPQKSWVSRWISISRSSLTPATVLRGAWGLSTSGKPYLGWTGSSGPKLLCSPTRHRAPHYELCCSHPVHPSVLNTPGQTWGDPEQGSEDHDQLLSKGSGVPPQSRDWSPPLEGALRNAFSAVLSQRPPTHSAQSSYCHLPSRPLPPQSHPPGLIPPYLKRPASKRWRPQRGDALF